MIDALYLVASLAGAILVASNVGHQLIGYCLFIVSSVCCHWLLTRSKAAVSLVVVNGVFLLINIIGVIRA